MSSSEEFDLVQRAKQGEEMAFATLMQRYERPIYNLTLRMTGKHEDAEELTQTAFLKAWRALPQFQEDSTFFTWLYRLATNTAIDFLRQENRKRLVLQTVSLDQEEHPAAQIMDQRQNPEEQAMQQDRKRALMDALEQLSLEHREILIQRELDGLSYQEIAELLSLELGTVKSRIARARLALRKILLQNGNFFEEVSSEPVRNHAGGERQ